MYAKLFASIYQGTLRGNTRGLVVFTNMLAHADAKGWVDMHPKAIADEVGLPITEVEAAILELESPDPESRSPEENGRRIMRLDEHRAWGWRIVNHAKYRAIRSEEDRREQNRLAQSKWRESQRKSAESKQDKPRKPPSAQAEAKAEAEESKEVSGAALRATPPPAVDWNDSKTKGIHPIPAAWELPESWGLDAEALGWKPRDVWNESIRFRMYWTTGKGAGKRRSVKGWRSSWTNWLSKAERMAA